MGSWRNGRSCYHWRHRSSLSVLRGGCYPQTANWLAVAPQSVICRWWSTLGAPTVGAMTTNALNRTTQGSILSLRSPDAVIAAVPYLLGFMPSESLVIVWLSADQIRLTQRVDLPSANFSVSLNEYCEAVAITTQNIFADEAIICVFSDEFRGESLPFTNLVTNLMVAIQRAHVGVVDALLIRTSIESGKTEWVQHWWSYLRNDDRLSRRGQLLDEHTASLVKSRFALEGVAVLPGRADLERIFAADIDAGVRIEKLIEEQNGVILKLATGTNREDSAEISATLAHWREVSIEAILRIVLATDVTDEVSDSDMARVIFCLGDIRVRDTLLWHLVQKDERVAALSVLTSALRAAPAGLVAPIATCTSICAWLTGDGARALVALDRGHVDDPEYPLAQLVAQGLAAGLPPSTWAAVMAAVTEEQCRTGK